MAEIKPERHWLLTIWISILILIDVLRAWYDFVHLPLDLHVHYPNLPSWYAYSLGIISIGTIVSLVGILRWSIWGVWGYCLFKLITVFIQLTFNVGNTPRLVMIQIIFVVILLVALNVGGEKKAWKQLKY